MKIYDVKVNNIRNPVGYRFDSLIISWKIKEAKGIKQENALIEVSLEKNFNRIIYKKQDKNLNSLGEKLDLDILPYSRYYFRIKVESDTGEKAESEAGYFETAKINEKWIGEWIGTQKGDGFHPEFIKKFTLSKKLEKARLYITGLGLFEAYINDIKTGNDFLAPFINDYADNVQYCTYDITESIREENEIKVILGNGWYKGHFGFDGKKNRFGNRFSLIAELRLVYQDGTTETVTTDDTWGYRESLFDYSDIYGGETQNFLKYLKADGKCKKAETINVKHRLSERYSLPVHEMEDIPVKEVIITTAGETVLDMGQNFAGYLECLVDIPSGDRIVLEFGEILQNGEFYRDNYRTAKSRFVYISDGKKRKIRPHFTFFGFRYVKVTGLYGLNQQDFIGKAVYSEMNRTGYFNSSHEKLNKLYENTLWGLKSNFLDMPTDCPQRDERLGWTGDAQVFCRTAGYHMDVSAFYQKYLTDLRTDQVRNNGAVALYLPNTFPGSTASVWGDAATIIPEMLYDYFGSLDQLKKNYPLMKDWVEYIHQNDINRGRQDLYNFGFQLGDWLSLDGPTESSKTGGTDHFYIASMFYYMSTVILSKSAEIIGKPKDKKHYGDLANSIKKAILNEYFSPNGRLCIDTQTGYLLALKSGIFHKKEYLVDGLKNRLKMDCYKIKGGFVGATIINTVMADNGLVNLAYDFLLNEKFPGWMYTVNLGATTIWERWDSVMPDKKINGNEMNSLNHYSFGAVSEFLYRNIAGIKAAAPGFKKAILSPHPDYRLRFIRCEYDSASGIYVSEWKLNDDGSLTLHFEVPFGSEAVVKLPENPKEPFTISAGSHDFEYMPLKDFRYPFSGETRIELLAQNKKAKEIISEKIPMVMKAIKNEDIELMSNTLSDLKPMFYLGYEADRVQEAIDLISVIKVY